MRRKAIDIPGFEIEQGKTFQVTGDAPCIFDFELPDILLEWHPTNPRFDASEGDYETFLELLGELPDKERRSFRKWFRDDLQ